MRELKMVGHQEIGGPKSDPIRVLALLEADSISGAAKSVLELAHAARLLDTSPAIHLSIARFSRGLVRENDLSRATAELGLPMFTISERRRFDISVLPQLQQLVRATQPNVIWSNSVKSHFLVRLAGLHQRAGWVAFHHGYTTTDLRMRIYNHFDLYSLRAAHCVLTPCRPFASELVRRGVPGSRIHVQHMPIRPLSTRGMNERDKIRRELGLKESSHLLLSIGRLSKEKGHLDLIQAFAAIRGMAPELELKLVLVGEGPERRNIEMACDELKVSSDVALVGQQSEVAGYYAAADLFLLTSHSEGSPNVLLEAMVSGVPVIATRVGGVPEIATNEEDALLVPKGNPRAIAEASLRLLSDPELRARLARTAMNVATRHSPEAYFQSMQSFFAQVASR